MTTLLLLDSQVALWVLDDSPRLGPHARRMVESTDMVHVSVATVWELTIKAMLGKLTVPDKLASRLAEQGLSLLSVTSEHAEALREFPNSPNMTRLTGFSSPRRASLDCGFLPPTRCC